MWKVGLSKNSRIEIEVQERSGAREELVQENGHAVEPRVLSRLIFAQPNESSQSTMASKEIVPLLPTTQAAFTATLIPQPRCDYEGCELLARAVQSQCAWQAILAVAIPSQLNFMR
jgi:hypothetical protein